MGAAFRWWVLSCCVLSALSASTVTQQSSSAWGSIGNGRPPQQGTHTSHTTINLPHDLPDIQPDLDLGGGPEDELELGFRGGFGLSRPQSRPQPQPQPQPSVSDVGQDESRQPVPSADVGPATPQQPVPSAGAGYDAQQPTVADVNAINEFYRSLYSQYPNYGVSAQQPWTGFPQRYPSPGLWRGYQRPRTWFSQPPLQLGTRGRFDIGRPSVGANFGPSWQQQTPVSGPSGVPPAGDAAPAVTPWAAPPTPTPGSPGDGLGYPSTPVPGGDGLTGAAVPPLGQPGHPQFQVPDLRSFVDQMTAQVFQNAPRGLTHGLPQGTWHTADGSGGYVRHRSGSSGGGVSLPGQPGVQSQHASVDSVTFQRTRPAFYQPRLYQPQRVAPLYRARTPFPAPWVLGSLPGQQVSPPYVPRQQRPLETETYSQ